ncbi:hypothetical protein RhiirC2_347319 [Rhizophagus irregularis]|uniref:Uncharacterized protein n=1 Tax=Rhizophagus irregularis TaxID=588596 RepID=A0A2N1NH92_9GLOM|nr:hypothetical protein RhiirC2_347319 [Rhizophagus irregularis]
MKCGLIKKVLPDKPVLIEFVNLLSSYRKMGQRLSSKEKLKKRINNKLSYFQGQII